MRDFYEFAWGKNKSDEVLNRITKFTSNIWQVHPFMEGNTRTTAVFIERYLNSIGFHVDNSLFAKKARYFRNPLVRANYADFSKGIDASLEFLKSLYENLLFEGKNNLSSRDMVVGELF